MENLELKNTVSEIFFLAKFKKIHCMVSTREPKW